MFDFLDVTSQPTDHQVPTFEHIPPIDKHWIKRQFSWRTV